MAAGTLLPLSYQFVEGSHDQPLQRVESGAPTSLVCIHPVKSFIYFSKTNRNRLIFAAAFSSFPFSHHLQIPIVISAMVFIINGKLEPRFVPA